jgi:hypothetical protein
MATIVTRAGKGSPLTNAEVDANFTGLNTEIPQRTNPLARAIAVQMTAAASGSNGIQQLSNVQNNFGIGDFTLHWEGSLPDWTPSVSQVFIWKASGLNNISFNVSTSGLLSLFLISTSRNSTVAHGIADGAMAKITVSVVRETVSTAGSVTFYVNGVQLGSSVVLPAGAPTTVTNAVNLQISGFSATRTESNTQAARLFNRALTAAEVLDLAINGVALADRGAGQTPVYESDFSAGVDGCTPISGAGVLTGNQDGIAGQDNWLKTERTVATGDTAISVITPIFTDQFAKNNRIQVTVHNSAAGGLGARYFGIIFSASSGLVGNQTDQWAEIAQDESFTFTFNARSGRGNGNILVVTTNSSGVVSNTGANTVGQFYYVRDIVQKQIGLTSELIASNAQSNTGQILDSSGNKNHALLPASGATVVGRPVSQTREVRWTNTWDGTNELQYIGGVNQAILPANAYIESIIGTVSGATPHDIIVGDGSDTDRYVTITTGLAAGTTNFALAARTTDGTNLKLTVDPDTNATMSIAWVIRYSTLEA